MQVPSLPTFLVALCAGILGPLLYRIVYRLFLSPIASVPGPRLAALTTLYAAYYDVFLPAQYVFKIKKLHKEYGKVIPSLQSRTKTHI
jgi:hypothetical protein